MLQIPWEQHGGDQMKKVLTNKLAIFIYGFISGWIVYLLILLFALRNMT